MELDWGKCVMLVRGQFANVSTKVEGMLWPTRILKPIICKVGKGNENVGSFGKQHNIFHTFRTVMSRSNKSPTAVIAER